MGLGGATSDASAPLSQSKFLSGLLSAFVVCVAVAAGAQILLCQLNRLKQKSSRPGLATQRASARDRDHLPRVSHGMNTTLLRKTLDDLDSLSRPFGAPLTAPLATTSTTRGPGASSGDAAAAGAVIFQPSSAPPARSLSAESLHALTYTPQPSIPAPPATDTPAPEARLNTLDTLAGNIEEQATQSPPVSAMAAKDGNGSGACSAGVPSPADDSCHAAVGYDSYLANKAAMQAGLNSGDLGQAACATSESSPARPKAHNVSGSYSRPGATLMSQKLLQSVRNTPYSSKLGRKVKMCVKTRTGMGVDELPMDLGRSLQDALRGMGLSSGYAVMDMSVREGCLVLSLNLLQQLGGATDNSGSADEPSAVVQALMPVLEPLLMQQQLRRKEGEISHANASPADVFEHGQCYLILQVDDGALRVVWDGQQEKWVVEQGDESAPGASGSQQTSATRTAANGTVIWHLGPAQQVGHVTAGSDLAATNGAGHGSGTAIGTAPASCAHPAGRMRLHVWCMQRQLGDPLSKLSADDGASSTPALQVQGWTRPPPGYHADGVWSKRSPVMTTPSTGAGANDVYEVLLKCQGHYVQTHATVISAAGQDTRPGTWLLQVDVDFKELVALQLRHGQDCPALSILPVVVELCQEQITGCVASVPLVLNMPAPSSPPSPLSGVFGDVKVPTWLGGLPTPGAWWWGSWGGAAMRAMQDIFRMSEMLCNMQQLAGSGHGHTNVNTMTSPTPESWTEADLWVGSESHHAFVADLIVWLGSVHALAVRNGQCVSGDLDNRLAGTELDGPVVKVADLADLGVALIQHAQTVGAEGVAAMVAQQQKSIIHPALHAKQMSASPVHNPPLMQRVWAPLRLVAVGCECEMCELHYKTRLSKQLHGVQVLSSGAYATMGLAANVTAWVNKQSWNNFAMLPWGLVHLAICIQHWLTSVKHISPRNRPVHTRCSWLGLVAYLIRVLVQWAMVVGAIPVMDAAREQMSRGDWVFASIVLTLGEQMQASTLMSAGPFLLISFLESITGTFLTAYVGAHFLVGPGMVVMCTAPRLLLDIQMRRLLRVPERTNSTAANRMGMRAGADGAGIGTGVGRYSNTATNGGGGGGQAVNGKVHRD